MNEIILNNIKYKLLKDEKEGFDYEALKEKATDYFANFDYIVGDWAYGKLRLKGFYKSNNKNCQKINNVSNLEKYIANNCAYGCRWFQIEKLMIEKE